MSYIFCISTFDDETVICIVDEEYFKQHGCLSDVYPDDDFWKVLPGCLYEIAESTYESELSEDETRQELLKAGFVESEDLKNFIDDCGN
jgi:hypothetical protein